MTTVNINSKKRKRNIILLSLLLVIATALYIVASSKFKEEEVVEETTATEIEIFKGINAEDIEGLRFKNADEDLTFLLVSDGVWQYAELEDFPVEASKISSMLQSLLTTTATRKIEVSEENIEKYGFEEPQLAVDLIDDKGNKIIIRVGYQNKVLGEYYVRLNEENVVYTVPETIMSVFAVSLYELGEIEEITNVTTTNIDKIEISNAGKKVKMVNEGTYGLDLMSTSKWYMLEPFNVYKGIDDYVFEDYLEVVTGFSFYRLADYNVTDEELKEHGLYDSEQYIEITYTSTTDGQKVYHLAVGNIAEEEESTFYYVHPIERQGLSKTDSRRVYIMTATSVAALINVNPLDYVFPQVAYTRLDQLDSMEITYEDKTYEIEIREIKEEKEETTEEETTEEGVNALQNTSGMAKKLEFYVDGVKVEDEAFRNFYKNLISLSGENVLYDEKDAVGGDNYVKIVFNRNEELYPVIEVEYNSHDIGTYETVVNGDIDYTISKTKVKAVVEEFLSLVK